MLVDKAVRFREAHEVVPAKGCLVTIHVEPIDVPTTAFQSRLSLRGIALGVVLTGRADITAENKVFSVEILTNESIRGETKPRTAWVQPKSISVDGEPMNWAEYEWLGTVEE